MGRRGGEQSRGREVWDPSCNELSAPLLPDAPSPQHLSGSTVVGKVTPFTTVTDDERHPIMDCSVSRQESERCGSLIPEKPLRGERDIPRELQLRPAA